MITEKPELEKKESAGATIIKQPYCPKCKKPLNLRELEFNNNECRCKTCKTKINIKER